MYSTKERSFISDYYRRSCGSVDGFVYIYSKNPDWKTLFLCSVNPLTLIAELTFLSQVQFAEMRGGPGLLRLGWARFGWRDDHFSQLTQLHYFQKFAQVSNFGFLKVLN